MGQIEMYKESIKTKIYENTYKIYFLKISSELGERDREKEKRRTRRRRRREGREESYPSSLDNVNPENQRWPNKQ